MSKKPNDGFYRDKNGKLEYPPDHIGRKTYISCKGFDYSVPKDYTFFHGGTRYFLGDPDAPEDTTLPSMYRGDDIRHHLTKHGPAPRFKEELARIKRNNQGSTINDWS